MTFLEDLLNDLPELVDRMRRHDVNHVSWKNETGELSLMVAAHPNQIPQSQTVIPPVKVENCAVISPEMGVFHLNGLSEGMTVQTGDIVGFVDADVLRLPVTARIKGSLGKALVESGTPVGYHDILFQIHPAG